MDPDTVTLEESALFCASSPVLATATGEFMFMPAGLQTITPFGGGIGTPIQVMVDRKGADELERQRTALSAKGKRPYFDFEHKDDGASFWPSAFVWKDGSEPGIYCRGEWTATGKEGVEGKTWRSFSPVFHVDNKRGNPARIEARDGAHPNMGGLVNDPAFRNISPLWAKNAGGAHPTTTDNNTDMDPKEVLALQAKNTELETELSALKAKQSANQAKGELDELVNARIEAKEATLKANKAELESAALRAKNDEQDTAIKARNLADAKVAVQAAIDRGAIAAKDADSIDQWTKDITENPARAALLAKMGGSPALGGRVTQSHSGVTVGNESANGVMKAYAAIVAKNARIPLSHETAKEKDALAREAAAIFAADISGKPVFEGMSVEEAIKAADYSDPNNQVGLLSGSLALQRSLALFQYKLPLLQNVYTDFSGEPGLYNQTTNTRIVITPAVQTYDPTLGTDNRPKGWTTVSPARTVDVPVTLDEYVGVPLVFGTANLGATVRNLFGESAPQAVYALGKYFVDKATALMTAANFNAYAVATGTTDTGGATTNNSKNVTVTDSTLCYPGQLISGAGIPTGSFIVSITSSTVVVISNKATATASGVTLTLNSGKIPTAYATYVKQLADFSSASLGDIAGAFQSNEVPEEDRFAMLLPSYYRKLGQDPLLGTFFAAMQSPEIINEGKLPRIQGFNPIEAGYFPTSSNRVGFAGQKNSIVLKTRLPMDFTQALGGVAVPGSVSTVTDPVSGLTVMLVQRVDLTGNYAEWRPEIMLGAAVGDRRAGMVITSA